MRQTGSETDGKGSDGGDLLEPPSHTWAFGVATGHWHGAMVSAGQCLLLSIEPWQQKAASSLKAFQTQMPQLKCMTLSIEGK